MIIGRRPCTPIANVAPKIAKTWTSLNEEWTSDKQTLGGDPILLD